MTFTKIVCTIGPATREPEMLEQLILGGMDVARLNFSHGGHEVHAENIARIRAACERTGRQVAIMTDLQGPKLRVGKMAEDGVSLSSGERVRLTTEDVLGQRLAEGGEVAAVLPVQYAELPTDVDVGERILIDDGLMDLLVEAIEGQSILAQVITGGVVRDHKGLNVPGTGLSIPSITEKDWEDLDFAIEQGVDWVALSFVRSPDEVRELQAVISKRCPPDALIRVVAKIEKPQALEKIEEIVEAADAIMVARGDLGIEVPAERVPMIQKRVIRVANSKGKPVITATQMLDSMIRNPRPTRAEASDVANAILDGTDAVMLSGETAVGKYPLAALKTMERIAEEIEATTLHADWQPPPYLQHQSADVTEAVSYATCSTAYEVCAQAIIAATSSGRTARTISKYRPHTPIIAVTPNPSVQRQLCMSWGVMPLLAPRADTTDDILGHSIHAAHEAGLVKEGERVVMTAGVTTNMPGTTNLMTVEQVASGGERVKQKPG